MNIHHNTHVQTTALLSGLSHHFDLQKVRLIKCSAIVPAQASGTLAKGLYYTDAPFNQVQLGHEKIVFGVLSGSGATGTGTLNILATASSGDLSAVQATAASAIELVNDVTMTVASGALCTLASSPLGGTAVAGSSQGYLSLKVDGETIGTSGKANLTLLTLSV
jgi:hypothetical protein